MLLQMNILKDATYELRKHLSIQIKLEKRYKNLWNMFKVNNEDVKTTSLTSLWCISCRLYAYFTSFSSVSFTDFAHAFVSVESINKVVGNVTSVKYF